MSKESRLMKNTAIIAVGNICTKCITFFMLPLYTSILSTEEYGTIDLINTYVTLIVAVLTLQFEQGVFRYLIEARSDRESQKKYITTSLCTLVFLSFAFTAILTPVLLLLRYEFTIYLVLWVVIGMFNAIMLQIPRGLGNNTIYAIGSCISGSSNVLLNVLFVAVFAWGVRGMLLASIISLVISVIYIGVKLRLWQYVDLSKLDKKAFGNLAKYSLPLIPNQLGWWIINSSDRIIIKSFMSVAANGIYSVACKFPSVFSMAANIFQLSWTESASENVSAADREGYYQGIMMNSIRFYSSCNIGIIALMPFVFPVLVKADFVEAYYYIPILMTGALFHSVASLYGSLYTAFKMTKEIAKTMILSAVTNIVINVALINVIGLYAASISTVAAYILLTIARHTDIQKKVKIYIDKKYLFVEGVVYAAVFTAYYSKSTSVQIITLIILVPYCFYQNKKVIRQIVAVIQNKRLKERHK